MTTRLGLLMIASLALFTACGQTSEPTVEERLDALIASGIAPVHRSLPSPARRAQLERVTTADEASGTPDALPETPRHNPKLLLLKTDNGRSLLEAGQTVVPDLVRLLPDEKRGTLAAVFLAEIGGEAAARGLLDEWRRLRGNRLKIQHYVEVDEDGEPSRVFAQGFRYQGVRETHYGEILHALAYAGLPVATEIAADTRKAMQGSEMRQYTGQELRHQEEAGRELRRWRDPELETATEGLETLAMLGAPEAVELFLYALGSPISDLRWEAAQNAYYLGEEVRPVVPSLSKALDDPSRALRMEALRGLQEILQLPRADYQIDDAELEEAIASVRSTLEDRGYVER